MVCYVCTVKQNAVLVRSARKFTCISNPHGHVAAFGLPLLAEVVKAAWHDAALFC